MANYSHLSIFRPAKSAFVVEPDGTASMGLWFWLRCDKHCVWVRLATDFTSNGQSIGYAKLINTGEVENGLFAYWLAAVLPTLPAGECLNSAKEFINIQGVVNG
jgi:hypothetical protein